MTAEQKEKMKGLREEQKKAMEPLRHALKTQVDELRVLLDKDAPDSALGAKLDEIRKSRMAIRDLEEKFMTQETSVLTVRQRAERAVRMGDRGGRPGRKAGMKREGPPPGCPMMKGRGGPGGPDAPGQGGEGPAPR
jgi:Spy/CpxP family protein refolding chaperone